MANMVKIGDYIMDFLYHQGLRDLFVISGGGNIHLIDSLGRSKLNYVCNHHEQASATAAEGYSRITGNFGACLVTTGPGGTNAITGVLGAWLDSIPMIVISGQVRRDLIEAGANSGVRQMGIQEINIIDIVKNITKYAVTVMDPLTIRYHLEKALYLARLARPGPVWLDIPLDVQGSLVKVEELRSFKPSEIVPPFETEEKKLKKLVSQTINKIEQSRRPVLYVGNGIRLAHAEQELLELADILKIPILTSYVGYDLIPSSHPYFFGRSHYLGQRSANFIVQNSDLFLSIGARLDLLTIGYTYKAFARQAYKIMVDIDKNEIKKPVLDIDLPINYDAKAFIKEMSKQLKKGFRRPDISEWLGYGRKLIKKYPTVYPEFWQDKKYVNPYCFIEKIGQMLRPNEIIVASDGIGPLNCMYQAFYVKRGQRIVLNLGSAQMGYGLPAAVGASFATKKKKRIICFEGDGSIQLNIQELQTIKHHNLPIKIFVYSNDGYQSIRNTQDGLFEGRYFASNAASGVSCPDFLKVGKAYGIRTVRINNHQEMEEKIKYVLSYRGPILCDINTVRNLHLTPRVQTKKRPDGSLYSPPLEEMWPPLPDGEQKENMLIPDWEG